MIIRREQAFDEAVVAAVTAAAFAPSRIEQRLLAELRAGADWIPQLWLVAIGDDGAPVGHVVCTRARLGAGTAVGLGPISVRPDFQRAGVGIDAPDPEWGACVQARPLAAWEPALAGRFVYAEPFARAD